VGENKKKGQVLHSAVYEQVLTNTLLEYQNNNEQVFITIV
jgi:hypothetical protein